LGPDEPIPPSEVRTGTTLATNALLERRGVRSALLITRGFRDLLEIGDQTRPQLFELHIAPPERLYERVLEIETRAAPDGSVLAREPRESLLTKLAQLRATGIRSLAVVVLHAYAASALELELRELARAAGFEDIALSHEVAAQMRRSACLAEQQPPCWMRTSHRCSCSILLVSSASCQGADCG
jgi:5-oxoprolinase (ATP-hydrolysing)